MGAAAAYYHCSVDGVSRARGRSIVAAAAYRAGERLTEESTGEVHDYKRRKGVLESFIVVPDGAPSWAMDRERLWNEADRAEHRANGRFATELELALPHELDAAQRRELAREIRARAVPNSTASRLMWRCMCRVRDATTEIITRMCWSATVNWGRRGSARSRTSTGFARRSKGSIARSRLSGSRPARAMWRACACNGPNAVNAAYREAGLDLRTDHRSHRDRGLEVEPTQHLGPAAAGMERRGERSERGDLNRDIHARNAERERLNREAGQVSAEIIDLAAERAKRAAGAGRGGGESSPKPEPAKPRRSPGEVLEQLTARQAVFTWRDHEPAARQGDCRSDGQRAGHG